MADHEQVIQAETYKIARYMAFACGPDCLLLDGSSGQKMLKSSLVGDEEAVIKQAVGKILALRNLMQQMAKDK